MSLVDPTLSTTCHRAELLPCRNQSRHFLGDIFDPEVCTCGLRFQELRSRLPDCYFSQCYSHWWWIFWKLWQDSEGRWWWGCISDLPLGFFPSCRDSTEACLWCQHGPPLCWKCLVQEIPAWLCWKSCFQLCWELPRIRLNFWFLWYMRSWCCLEKGIEGWNYAFTFWAI